MKAIITSNRLFLRELNKQDALSFFLLNKNPKNLKYTGDVPFTNLDNAKQFLMNYEEYHKNGFGRWAVVRKSDLKFLGWCGLKRVGDEVDLGFRFYEEFWNNGYATESAKAVIEYAFKHLQLEKLVARCHPNNLASKQVINKLGFSLQTQKDYEGILNAFIYTLHKPR